MSKITLLIEHLKNAHNLIIGEKSAERLLMDIEQIERSVTGPEDVFKEIRLRGLNQVTHMPNTVGLTYLELKRCLTPKEGG